MERVSVISPELERCALPAGLPGVAAAPDVSELQISYVVDNGSADGSLELLRREFPEVVVVGFPENRGFSVAINAGIAASRGEYLVALNNDTESDPHWLEELVRTLDSRPDIGFCASKILDFTERSVIDSFGDGYTYATTGAKASPSWSNLTATRRVASVLTSSRASPLFVAPTMGPCVSVSG